MLPVLKFKIRFQCANLIYLQPKHAFKTIVTKMVLKWRSKMLRLLETIFEKRETTHSFESKFTKMHIRINANLGEFPNKKDNHSFIRSIIILNFQQNEKYGVESMFHEAWSIERLILSWKSKFVNYGPENKEKDTTKIVISPPQTRIDDVKAKIKSWMPIRGLGLSRTLAIFYFF